MNAWEKRKLGDLSTIRRGASPRPISSPKWFSGTSSVGWLRISDVTEQNGRVYSVAQHLSEKGQKKTLVLTKRHLILSIAATVGKPVQNYTALGIHDGFIVFMNPKFDLDFMFYFLEKYQPQWMRFGQPGSQVNLNSELVRNLEIRLPRRDEQEQVSKILLKLDNLIAATQQKLDNLRQVKKSMSQHLLGKSIRFREFSATWEKRKLGDLLKERNVQHPQSSEYPLVSFTVENGVTPKTERYEREQLVRGDKQAKRYKETRLDDIVYNPANLKFGAIARNSFGKAVFSPIYVTFEVNQELALAKYVELLVTQNSFLSRALRYQQGTVYERQSVSPRDLLNLSVALPDKEEQMNISLVFSRLDKLIMTTQSQLSTFKILKKSLLQNLFV